jgi:hypothetical protein
LLRLDRTPSALTVVSRLARPRVLVIVAGAFVITAALEARPAPRLAAALAIVAALFVVLGGRTVRATFARGRVRIRPSFPLEPRPDRALGEFARTAVETIGHARARRAERVAEGYRERSGKPMPDWLHAPAAPGVNDHLRRLVLVPRGRGEPLAVTAWLAPEDDLEALRAEVESLLR